MKSQLSQKVPINLNGFKIEPVCKHVRNHELWYFSVTQCPRQISPLTPTIIPLFSQTVASWNPYLQDLISASEANVKDDKSFKTMTDNSLGYCFGYWLPAISNSSAEL